MKLYQVVIYTKDGFYRGTESVFAYADSAEEAGSMIENRMGRDSEICDVISVKEVSVKAILTQCTFE